MKLHFCEAIGIEILKCQRSVEKALRKCEKYWRKCWKVSSMRVLISCWEGVEKVYSKWMGVKVLDRLSPLKAGYSLCRKFSIHQLVYSNRKVTVGDLWPEICLRYSWNMHKIWLRFAWNKLERCLRLVWDMLEICLAAWHMIDICLRYSWYLLEIILIYAWDLLQICWRYAWDKPEICF